MGDTIEKEIFREPRSEETEKKRKLPRGNLLLVLVIAATLALTSLNTLAIYGQNGPSQFPGSTQVSVVAHYSYGPSPGSLIVIPGDTATFQLTVTNRASASTPIMISFNATNADDWNTANNDFPTTHFTMTINGARGILPINGVASCHCNGLVSSVTYTAPSGTSNIVGTIAVASNADQSGFSLDFFATPA